jgi:23S rRNA (guanosine2251-2'-O)-methyltransferase
MILSSLNPIIEALRTRPRQIEWVMLDSERHDRRINELKALCREAGVSLRYGERRAIDRLARPNQGAVARLAVREYAEEEEAVAGVKGERFLLILDEIQDPQNLGAVIRVAEGLGARVILPERGSAPLSEAVEKTSAGAVERVPVVRVKNLRRFIDSLKDQGFRVVGLDPAGTDIYGLDLTGDLALVFGAEGTGMRRLVREGCDFLARLPMRGALGSLNVATAASAAGYEALRQRTVSGENP